MDPEQAWFWTSDWLAGELEAERETDTDPGVVYEDAEAFKSCPCAQLANRCRLTKSPSVPARLQASDRSPGRGMGAGAHFLRRVPTLGRVRPEPACA